MYIQATALIVSQFCRYSVNSHPIGVCLGNWNLVLWSQYIACTSETMTSKVVPCCVRKDWAGHTVCHSASSCFLHHPSWNLFRITSSVSTTTMAGTRTSYYCNLCLHDFALKYRLVLLIFHCNPRLKILVLHFRILSSQTYVLVFFKFSGVNEDSSSTSRAECLFFNCGQTHPKHPSISYYYLFLQTFVCNCRKNCLHNALQSFSNRLKNSKHPSCHSFMKLAIQEYKTAALSSLISNFLSSLWCLLSCPKEHDHVTRNCQHFRVGSSKSKIPCWKLTSRRTIST